MEQLPPALVPLAAYPQFIVWKLIPDTPKDRKVPFDPVAMRPGDAHDPRMWLSAQDAITQSTMLGDEFGVGFVFTAADPFFFVDIDTWPSPIADELCAAFQGAAVEVSHSGHGLHIIGTGQAPQHRSRNGDLNIEFYTERRFVALTGQQAQGDAAFDATLILPWLVDNYFPPQAGQGETGDDWTTAPDPAWSGPDDDDVLLNKMLSSGGAGQAFGAKLSVSALWHRQVDVLSKHYPDQSGDREYDYSAADAALAQHLAFWTGKDCERIERLMRRSELLREKWDRPERGRGYLRNTIIRACYNQHAVYNNQHHSGVNTDLPPPPPGDDGEALGDTGAGWRFMTVENQRQWFAGCVYVRDLHRVWTPDGAFLKPEQFRAVYGGYVFAVDGIADKTTRSAWEAFSENQAWDFPKVMTTCFRPELPSGRVVEEESQTKLNTYVPILTEQRDGDPAPFLDLIARLLPNEDDRRILLSYMAAVVQYPGVKFQWCPLLQGAEGNGKTLILKTITHAIGHRYTHLPNANELGAGGQKFNQWLRNKLFIGIEEIYVSDRREVTEALKPLITNDRVEIQGKGSDQITDDNRANFIMMSNHKDAMRVSFDSRRYAVFYTAQQSAMDLTRDGMDGEYFPKLYEWCRREGYAIVNKWLHEYEIPDELNPATKCQRAPQTSSTQEAVALSMGAVEQEVMEAVDENRPGFAGGWISSIKLDQLLDDLRAGGKVPRNRRRAMLQSLGYDWHPALDNGRVNNPIAQEGGKPKLFSRLGHIINNIDNPSDAVRNYMEAQGYAPPPADHVDGKVNSG